ncbi:endonuclease/exonuclease/phosphatase family protein [Brevundimonas lenta]|uniref:Endonuclease/exonuclease/phosphatase family metal-dependent hydrolase n=1 Tax=Brevundimonas lenta TaxID=424796 RepID=A0A7W6NQG3_9CAUL|nr:endonuclease/exonuclease/phosphatase family protein [Brevundimonas lenta]MBB4083150.1 endonuclease/exonuclease/phosphatase family metal-dependent hydrolase [Brevundimonas lenta]
MLDRRTLLAALAATPLAACATTATQDGKAPLRLVTFNIWHNQGNWAARLPLIVAELKAQDADVIALQEVLEDAAVGLPNQATTIAGALGGYEVYFVSTDPEDSGRRYGNAILSRLPVLAHDTRKLEPLNDFRTAIRARVAFQGREIDVVGTHLAWQPDQAPVRAQQIADLLAWLPQDGTPLVVMGDFNAVQEDAGLAVLTGERFFSVLPRGSAPTTLNPAKGHQPRVIDHIFAETAHFAPVHGLVFGTETTGGEHPSDHFGVAGSIRLR